MSSLPDKKQDEWVDGAIKHDRTGARKNEVVEEEKAGEAKRQGVGIIRANEAINCLTRIPKNDALRKRGFQLVTDWIRRNK